MVIWGSADSTSVADTSQFRNAGCMCNLYNITTSQEAIRQWTGTLRDILGNLEPSIDMYPNQLGPVVRRGPSVLTRTVSYQAAPRWQAGAYFPTSNQSEQEEHK